MISKITTKWIKPYLNKLIEKEQNGFIKGRNIEVNIDFLFNESAFHFNNAFNILNAFGQRSGRKINMLKFSAFYVRSSKGKVCQSFSVNCLFWPQNLVKYISYVLTYQSTTLIQFTLQQKFSTYNRRSASTFKYMVISMFRKIAVPQSLVIAKIVYKATYLSVTLPQIFIKQLNQLMYKFIWGSKWERLVVLNYSML